MNLKVKNLNVVLGGLHILHDVSMKIDEGELVAVVGANGAGKTTLLRTISGIESAYSGTITLNGKEIHKMKASEIACSGVNMVPQGKQLFSRMTVLENIKMGAYQYRKDKARMNKRIDYVFGMFPALEKYKDRVAGTLSGGEQQMLTISRCLMSDPKILMVDELSLGLAPKIVDMLMKIVHKLNKEEGLSVILVEQNVYQALKIADRGYVIENGVITLEDTGSALLNNEHVRIAYLGL